MTGAIAWSRNVRRGRESMSAGLNVDDRWGVAKLVRHQTLTLACVGSSPAAPAINVCVALRVNIINSHHNEELSLHVHVVDGIQVFELTGSLDIATSPTVRASLTESSERGDHRLIVNLTNVDFLDSTGLGAIIGAQRRAKEFGGDVRLVVKEGQILRLLRITGLLKVLSVYSTLDDAVSDGSRVGDL